MLNEATGELVPGRCRATNLCHYCRMLGVIETAEMLSLDAMEHAPTLLLTLTAREHLTRPGTYDHLRHLRRATRRRWPSIEWFVQVEFQKRGALHLHLLVKGVPVDDADELLRVVGDLWCRRVDAELAGQSVKPVTGAEGLVRYLQKELAHGLKKEQAPPLGWRGHRTSQTRGYLVRPASVMREEARASLRLDRALWRAHNDGLEGEAAAAAAEAELLERAAATWRMFHQAPPRCAPSGPSVEDRSAVDVGPAVPVAGEASVPVGFGVLLPECEDQADQFLGGVIAGAALAKRAIGPGFGVSADDVYGAGHVDPFAWADEGQSADALVADHQ